MADKELTFKEIWDTLHNVDVSEYTEEKMNLTYLSWARAWMLLMEHYPEAIYSFVDYDGIPYRTLPDGTAEVITQVQIGNHLRSMSLPVMDYKNNPVVNPNARQVNDNRQRCLVKNLESDEPVVVIEQPKKKKTPSKKKAEVKEEPKPEVSEETFNEAWADTFLEATEKLIVMQETKEELTGFYKANTEAIARLKTDFPLHKEKLDQIFKDHAESLEDNSQENKE